MNLQFWTTNLSKILNDITDIRNLFAGMTEDALPNLEDLSIREEYRNNLEQLVRYTEEKMFKRSTQAWITSTRIC